MEKLIASRTDGSTRTITLERPEKRNALNADLVAELHLALEEAAVDDEIRCVVLTGAGDVFSAGADLAALQALQDATPMDNEADSRRLADLFRSIYLHPKPVIAKINGHAVAGGCGLAVVADFSVAASDAKLGFTEVRIGFVPAIVGVFAVRKLGETAARDLLLRGRLVTAEEAVALGLITSAVPRNELDRAVDGLARELANETSASALALTKRQLAYLPGMGLDEALEHAIQLNAFARGTSDCRAGVRAFLNKEDPPWRRS